MNAPTQYPGLFRSPDFAPREVFSISQIEKAFGSGSENLAYEPPEQAFITRSGGVVDSGPPGPGTTETGCLRAWGWRYLAGLKQPEYTWEEACALPEDTEALRRLKGGAKAKTWGKVAEAEIERYLKRDPSLATRPILPHIVAGLGLLPHPSELVSFELQAPIKVRTHPELITYPHDPRSGADPDSVTWQGFKDFVPTLVGGRRYLIDFKTTKPIVDTRKNEAAGRARDAWAYMKDPSKLVLDWQFNLYEWDEYVTHGALVPARWVYFASPGTDKYPNKPEARASDMPAPDLEIVRAVVLALDSRARILREHIRQFRAGALDVAQLPANTLACPAYGGCPYRVEVGGPCNAEDGAIIPIGRVTAKARTLAPRKAKHAPSAHALTPAIGPGFTFTIPGASPPPGAHDMNIQDQINARLAQAQASAPQPGPAPQPHAPGYPQSAAAHIGAPVPTQGMPPQFPAVQPGQAPGFNPAFAFGQQAPAPQAAPAPAPAVHGYGTPTHDPNYCHDGQGGYQFTGGAHLQGAAQAPVAASPTPGLPPEAFAPGGPAGPPAAASPIAVAAAPVPQPEPAKKKGPGRPKKDAQPEAPPTAATMAAMDREYAGTDALERATAATERSAAALERIATVLEQLVPRQA